jgi:sialic acid synthase SpsE
MKTLVIAECASAHDGRIDAALRLIDAAAQAGADVAKFQYWSDADALADRRHVPAIYRAIYHRYRMPGDWLPTLLAHAQQRNIALGVTCYLPQDVKEIAPYTAFYKVASFEALALDLRDAVARDGEKRVLVSVGMCDEVQVGRIRSAWGWAGRGLALLHCVSAYPAPIEACNLAVIREHGLAGFSDHTGRVLTGSYAVAAGASIIEFHIRLRDTDPSNPDFACALDEDNAAIYVKAIRQVEALMGDGIKSLHPVEQEMAQYRVGS